MRVHSILALCSFLALFTTAGCGDDGEDEPGEGDTTSTADGGTTAGNTDGGSSSVDCDGFCFPASCASQPSFDACVASCETSFPALGETCRSAVSVYSGCISGVSCDVILNGEDTPCATESAAVDNACGLEE
ncbi:MAG: hypothetical protein AAGA56_03880 [Myxococcota bacterium]